MIVHRIVTIFLLFFVLGHSDALAHGGVVEEDDLCVIKVNYLRAHFKVYQPAVRGLEQFCEDLPAATQSIFVMEYQHDSLSEMEIDFRIIRDITGKGRFARLEDVEQIANIEGVTVFYQDPVVEPDVYRLKKWFGGNSDAATMLVIGLFFAVSDVSASELRVSFTAPDGQPRINQMHSWILHIVDESGQAVEGARVEVDGGMPEHDHGLPTQPRGTEELGGGDYKLEGLRFHMSGYWEIVVRVTTESGTTVVMIPLQL